MTNAETRNLSRDSLLVLCDIKVPGGQAMSRVKVRNLSEGGLMAEGKAPVQRGDSVTVVLRNVGEVAGSVAWLQGDRFGIAFADPIDPKQVRAPVGSAEPSAPHYTRTGHASSPEPSRLRKI